MKKIYLLPFILTFILIFQSCATITTDSVPFVTVTNVEGSKKDELYVRANNWMVSAFKDAQSVIQFTDKETGTITGKYLLGKVVEATNYGGADYVFAIIQIQVKDGASKITITPQSFRYSEGNPYTLYTKEKASSDIRNLVSSFEKAIVQKENNNW